jgi:hypothetical protein
MASREFTGNKFDFAEKAHFPAAAISGEWLAVLGAFTCLLVATLLLRTGIVVRENAAFAAVFGLLASLGMVRFAARNPATIHARRARDFSEYTLLFFGIGFLGVIASYPAAAATTGLADSSLEHVDRMLHFDWLAWYNLVAHHAMLQVAGEVAYAGLYTSPLLLLGYFAWTHRQCHARRFIVTFWLGGLLTLALFPLFPAEGPLAFLWRGPIPYMPVSGLYQEQLIPALRAHQLRVVDMGALRGLVCAPSFHTVCAMLYIWAGWPIARLRWPIMAMNVAMLLSIPVEGTHYLTDMLVGAMVAITAIFAVRWALQVVPRWQTLVRA